MHSPQRFFVVTAIALLTCLSARADLLGTTVTGTLNFGTNTFNFFDTLNGFVPVGPLNKTQGNTVTIGPAVEFGFLDPANDDSANFTGNTLTIQDIANGQGGALSTYTFTSGAFLGLALTKISDTFVNGVTGSLINDTLVVQAPPFTGAGTFQAVFSLSDPTAVPEPQAIGLMVSGLALLGLAGRRKLP